jgi:hypothetical protein
VKPGGMSDRGAVRPVPPGLNTRKWPRRISTPCWSPGRGCRAVDALIVLAEPTPAAGRRPPVAPERIEPLFYRVPWSLSEASAEIRKWGHMLFANVLSGGYIGAGSIWSVQRAVRWPEEHCIVPWTNCPVRWDLAVVHRPAARRGRNDPRPQAKGVQGMVLITSGFSKPGRKAGTWKTGWWERPGRPASDPGAQTMGISNPYQQF